MRLLYTVLLYLSAPFVLLRLLWKSRQMAAYRGRIGERFGFVTPAPGGVAVWVHAVSVGETLAAMPLIEALIAKHGEGSIWVTTTTPTGSARVQASLGGRVRHSYAPYDLPDVVARFLKRVRPARVVVMETELWPNLFHACAARGMPPLVANARLSPRSAKGYGRIRSLIAPALASCCAIAAQSKEDAERFRALGAPHDIVGVTGNLKFDLEIPAQQVAAGKALRARFGERPLWAAVSTHEGEDDAALAAHQAVLEVFPDAVLILVPRHPQRFDAVWRAIGGSGLRAERRTRLAALDNSGHPQSLTETQVFLGDSMGEMFVYLAAADLAFVGGSFANIGGHNVLEPAALGIPVLFGPHMFNFEHARELLIERGAAVQLPDAPELAGEIAVLLGDPARRAAMGASGEAAVAGNRGALRRILDQIAIAPTSTESTAVRA
jgi:3-deoxy-D-manno-octulosonic-acid transferase